MTAPPAHPVATIQIASRVDPLQAIEGTGLHRLFAIDVTRPPVRDDATCVGALWRRDWYCDRVADVAAADTTYRLPISESIATWRWNSAVA